MGISFQLDDGWSATGTDGLCAARGEEEWVAHVEGVSSFSPSGEVTDRVHSGSVSAADSYALGLLLHSIFNPTHPAPKMAEPPHPPPQPSSRGSIPASVFLSFKKLLNLNPKGRMTPKHSWTPVWQRRLAKVLASFLGIDW